MRLRYAPLFLCLAAAAAAQIAPAKPWQFELGTYLPDYRGADFGKDVGFTSTLGYSFFQKESLSLAAEFRGTVKIGLEAGGGSSGSGFTRDSDLLLNEAFVNLRHQDSKTRLFTGVGLGVGYSTIDHGQDRTALLVSGEVGFYLTKAAYVVARYQTASENEFRGATLALGFSL